jgi:HlyD family secretion protein
VRVDQLAEVKFTAFKYRSMSMVKGRVTYVSGDRLTDRQNGASYYTASIQVDAEALRQAGEIKVQAGMPAEVYIQGTRQTPLQYIVEPVTTTIRKAGRQM